MVKGWVFWDPRCESIAQAGGMGRGWDGRQELSPPGRGNPSGWRNTFPDAPLPQVVQHSLGMTLGISAAQAHSAGALHVCGGGDSSLSPSLTQGPVLTTSLGTPPLSPPQ